MRNDPKGPLRTRQKCSLHPPEVQDTGGGPTQFGGGRNAFEQATERFTQISLLTR